MSAQIDFEKTEALLSAEPEIDFAATEQGLRSGFLYAQPLEPTAWDMANIIGREVVPAIGGAMLGSIGGPVGMAGGGAAGSLWGNQLSQQYRIERGLQSG